KDEVIGQRTIYLISDFHQSGWNAANDNFRLGKDTKLVPIDVSEIKAPNLAVSDVNAQPLVYQQKYSEKLTARISNFSDEPKTAVKVDFNINDHPVEKREINIPARDSQLVEFADFNLSTGPNRCVIEVSGDDFTVDDKDYFVINREEQSKALIVETATRGRSESFYLRNALTTGENLPFALTVKSAGSVSPAELSQNKVIILNDASGLQSGVIAQLSKFVEQGGGLIISVGPHTTTDEFNSAFKSISPASLRDAVQPRGEYVVMSHLKTDHPIFSLFQESGTLASAHVSGYFHSTPNEGASVLATLEDGSPALIEGSFGRGKVLLFTSTFDAGWNDLPLSPFYLPLVRQMMRYLGETEASASYNIGQPFAVPAGKDGQPPAVDMPNGERLMTHTLNANDELIVTPTEPGFYHLRYADQPGFVAANLNSGESDLSKLDVPQFVATVTGANVNDVRKGVTSVDPDPDEIESRQRVWWILLVIAALLFVAEALIAQRTRVAKVIG
ncbi:MAG TPA: hypothetical protein VFC63_22525, partial [Blastocatellia bacterium]|nr:hypothetical protein [Blastocatellia bacterium]